MTTRLGGLGHKPDPYDARDLPYKARYAGALPVTVARSQFTKTLNQGGLGSCTANGCAQVVRAQQVRQLVDSGTMTLEEAQAHVEFLARLFVYYLCRAIDGTTQSDDGTYIRNCYRVLNKVGFPPESLWPYSDDSDPATGAFARMPSSNAFRHAFDQRLVADQLGTPLVSYERITAPPGYRRNEVKRAIYEGHLVEFGTSVSEAFCSDASANGGKPIPPPTNLSIAGGHAMVWGGYDEDGPDTLNSWGDDFGDGGWFRMSWDYVEWSETTDIWIAKLAPLYPA